jgi:hypothetical protein
MRVAAGGQSRFSVDNSLWPQLPGIAEGRIGVITRFSLSVYQ